MSQRCQVCESDEAITSATPMRYVCERCKKALSLLASQKGRPHPLPSEAMMLRRSLLVSRN